MINIQTLPTELKDKYEINRNTFIGKDKGEVNEEREIEIGDVHSEDFQPQVKLKQWDNETNFSVRLIDDEPTKPTIETEGNKIKFIKKDRECHFYDIENGFEFEVILKKKPKTNLVQMSIESKGLAFYYQPELTQKEIDEGAFRPENVVGSYAVYHESKQGDYSKMGLKNYRAGKAFHIYRPKIIDNAGTEVWGKLNITDNLLTVEIPQEFLDNAVYPVRHAAGLTFGYTGTGISGEWISANELYGSVFTSPADIAGATIDSLSVYGYEDRTGTVNIKGVIALHSNLNIVTNGVGDGAVVNSSPADWTVSNFSTSPSLANSTDYVLMAIVDSGSFNYYFRYDYVGGSNFGHEDSSNNYTTPTNPTDASHSNNKYCIYCTYTAGAAEENKSKRLLRGIGI